MPSFLSALEGIGAGLGQYAQYDLQQRQQQRQQQMLELQLQEFRRQQQEKQQEQAALAAAWSGAKSAAGGFGTATTPGPAAMGAPPPSMAGGMPGASPTAAPSLGGGLGAGGALTGGAPSGAMVGADPFINRLTALGLSPEYAREAMRYPFTNESRSSLDVNPTSGALGRMQWLGPRKAALLGQYGAIVLSQDWKSPSTAYPL